MAKLIVQIPAIIPKSCCYVKVTLIILKRPPEWRTPWPPPAPLNQHRRSDRNSAHSRSFRTGTGALKASRLHGRPQSRGGSLSPQRGEVTREGLDARPSETPLPPQGGGPPRGHFTNEDRVHRTAPLSPATWDSPGPGGLRHDTTQVGTTAATADTQCTLSRLIPCHSPILAS